MSNSILRTSLAAFKRAVKQQGGAIATSPLAAGTFACCECPRKSALAELHDGSKGLLLSPRVFGQATSTESQTLEALLAEVHQLRQDLHAVATAGRRAQILIYRLYVQEAVVARAAKRFDQGRVGR